MHISATYFIGIILVSVSGSSIHTGFGEGLIDDTGLAASVFTHLSIEINTPRNKSLSPDEAALFNKMQKKLQFFLELLQVIGGDLNISEGACFTLFH
jgi:hypothetical protein